MAALASVSMHVFPVRVLYMAKPEMWSPTYLCYAAWEMMDSVQKRYWQRSFVLWLLFLQVITISTLCVNESITGIVIGKLMKLLCINYAIVIIDFAPSTLQIKDPFVSIM